MNKNLLTVLIVAATATAAFAQSPVYGDANVDALVDSAEALKTVVLTMAAGFAAWTIGSRLVKRFSK